MSKIDPGALRGGAARRCRSGTRVLLDHAAEPSPGDRRLRDRHRHRRVVGVRHRLHLDPRWPGDATMVPGLKIYQLAFFNREVGLASALAVVLMVLVLVCILPIQWFTRRGRRRRDRRPPQRAVGGSAARRVDGAHAAAVREPVHDGAPSVRHLPKGSRLAVRPALGQLRRRVPRRQHGRDLQVECADRARRRARLGRDRDDGGLRDSASSRSPAASSSFCSSCSV